MYFGVGENYSQVPSIGLQVAGKAQFKAGEDPSQVVQLRLQLPACLLLLHGLLSWQSCLARASLCPDGTAA